MNGWWGSKNSYYSEMMNKIEADRRADEEKKHRETIESNAKESLTVNNQMLALNTEMLNLSRLVIIFTWITVVFGLAQIILSILQLLQ